MGNVKERIEQIKKNKALRDAGKVLCIPFNEKFPKLSKSVPGIIKGIMYKVTAGSGVGKTQFTKDVFCITPLEYMRNHPESNIKVHILYFALEENESEFINGLLSKRIADKYKVHIDPIELEGYREKYPDEQLIEMLEDCEEDVQFYMNHITVIDSTYNPTGMYKFCRTVSEEHGKHHWEEKTFYKVNKDGEKIQTTEKIYSHYVPNDPDMHFIVIGDHISLIKEEYDKDKQKVLSKHEAMAKWSTDYCRKQITKHWNWTVVNVQQQEQSNEKQQYTSRGDSIVEKTEPTLDGLANNKEIQRDDYVVIGLYNPDKFGFDSYHEYDISMLRDHFRAAKVLKNRIGTPNGYIHFFFNGAINKFIELPTPKDKNYDKIMEKAYKAARVLIEGRGSS